MTRIFSSAACVFALQVATTAWADQVINDDLIVDGNICTGQDCALFEGFGGSAFNATLKLDSTSNLIWSNDTSEPLSGSPETDWRLYFNEPVVFGREAFYISD